MSNLFDDRLFPLFMDVALKMPDSKLKLIQLKMLRQEWDTGSFTKYYKASILDDAIKNIEDKLDKKDIKEIERLMKCQ